MTTAARALFLSSDSAWRSVSEATESQPSGSGLMMEKGRFGSNSSECWAPRLATSFSVTMDPETRRMQVMGSKEVSLTLMASSRCTRSALVPPVPSSSRTTLRLVWPCTMSPGKMRL
jgi:hypothetical protein